MDVDHFKRINDTHGHQAGDEVLRHVAALLRATVRHGDLAGRIGGEEFVVICLETDTRGATQLAERLRTGIASQAVSVAGSSHPLRCTVTIGISPPFHGTHDMEEALRQADTALYRGKAAGRNRIETASSSPGISDQDARVAMVYL